MRRTALLLCSLVLACGPEDEPDPFGQCAEGQECGPACAICDDGDETTVQWCLEEWLCGGVSLAVDCAPDCARSAGTLVEVQARTMGDGGMPGIGGAVSVAQGELGRHVYVASPEHGVSHFRRVEDRLLYVETIDVPGASAILMDRSRFWVVAEDLVSMTWDLQTGRISAPASLGDGGRLITSGGGRMLIADDAELRVHDPDSGEEIDATDATLHAVITSDDGRHVYGADGTNLLAWTLSDADGFDPITVPSGEPGLVGAEAVSMSPNGQQVYVAGFCDHEIAILDRDLGSGALTYRGVADAGGPAPFGCEALLAAGNDEVFAQPHRSFPSAIAVTDDGTRAIVAALFDQVAIYTRADDGALTLDSVIERRAEVLDFDLATETVRHDGAWWNALRRGAFVGTGDHERAWVVSRVAGVFREVTGEQTSELYQGGVGGIDALAGAYRLTLSPGAEHLYVAPRGDRRPAVFAVDADTGGLTPLPSPEFTEPGPGGRPGGLTDIDVGSDGATVYALDAAHGALRVFDRAGDGTLALNTTLDLGECDGHAATPTAVRSVPGAPKQVYIGDAPPQGESCLRHLVDSDGVWSIAETHTHWSLSGVKAIAMPKDGRFVVTGGLGVAHWGRDVSTGALTFLETIGPEGIEALALSADERLVYAVSSLHDLVVTVRIDDAGVTHRDSIKHGEGLELEAPAGVAASPDGRWLFVAARGSSAISTFELDDDGLPQSRGVLLDRPSLDGVSGLEIHPDGHLLFGAAVRASAVTSLRVTRPGGDGCGSDC